MKSKIFVKLLGIFVLLLVLQAAAMEFVFIPFFARKVFEISPAQPSLFFGNETFWSGLIALAVALTIAVLVAGRVAARLDRLMEFARRLAAGELNARLDFEGEELLSTLETLLNQSAARTEASITEVEDRRQELSAMLDSMQEAVVAVSPEGLIRCSNAQMQRIAGTQIHPGRPLVHALRDPELLACVRTALEERATRTARSSSLVPGRIFEINAAPMPSGGALAVLHDITRIEAAETSRREFIANVSHELRTPLTSIQGYVETLMEEPRPNRQTADEFLGIILKNATRMNRITEDLLALASVESPDYKLKLQPARSSVLLQEAIDSLGGIVVDSGVALETSGAPEAAVTADADAINQVFGNLIENALKYAKAGKRISLGARLIESQANPEVEFCVRDFSPGISSEHLGRIFERFYRVDKARSREAGGTGLGLAIVKHIVLAHGGRIWAESELGRGAAFFFTLPVVQ